jgi:hypothetical protein
MLDLKVPFTIEPIGLILVFFDDEPIEVHPVFPIPCCADSEEIHKVD